MAMKKNNNSQKNVYQAFDASAYTSCGITTTEVLEIKDAFDLLDSSASGTIHPNQLRSLFTAYGVELKNQSLQILVEQATATNAPIDFPTFLHMFTAFSYGGRTRATCKKVFRLFDDDNMGCISAKNLRRVVKELGLQLDEQEIQVMVDRADSDHDGVISEEEFYLIMTRIAPS